MVKALNFMSMLRIDIMVLTIILAKTCHAISNEDNLEIVLDQGSIIGSKHDLGGGKTYYAFKSIPYAKAPIGELRFREWSNEPIVMVPRVDGDYIPDDPVSLMKKNLTNKVHLMTGINTHDGAVTTMSIYHRDDLKRALIQNFTNIGPLVLNFRDGDEDPVYLARRSFHYYLGDVTITPDEADALTKLFTDRLFSTCSDQVALLKADEQKVYMYELHHAGQHKYLPAFNTSITENWVSFGDELQYLFDSLSGRNPLERPGDLIVRHIMVKLWTNFAATGNPTPDQSLGFRWTPATKDCLRYLKLKPDAAMHEDERMLIRAFWDDLPTAQNRILFPEKFLPGYSPLPSKSLRSC